MSFALTDNSPVPFNNVYYIIHRRIRFTNHHITIAILHLAQNSFDFVRIHIRQWDSIGDGDPSLVFLLNCDVRRFLVESDTEPFQFLFDDLFIAEGFEDVENNKDEVTSTSNCRRRVSVRAGKANTNQRYVAPAITCRPRPRPSFAPSMIPAAPMSDKCTIGSSWRTHEGLGFVLERHGPSPCPGRWSTW